MRNMLARMRTLLAAFALLAAGPAFADGPGDAGPDVAAPPVRAAPIQPAQPTAEPAAAPQGQTGQVTLLNGELSLNVPAAYRFYTPQEAQAFLTRNSAAAPNGQVLGLLAPASARIDQPGSWGTVVSYDAIGYVPPDGAGVLSETGFEGQVREARQTQSRTFEGFAIQPAFDPNSAGLAWAERTGAPGAATGSDFRHEQRILGRQGVASLTSVGAADQMGAITAALPDLIGMVSFPDGQRYADFQAASDPTSDWTIASLVTGVGPTSPDLVQTASAGAGQQQSGASGLAGAFPWIAGGVIVLAGAGYLLMRRRRDDDVEPEEAEATET